MWWLILTVGMGVVGFVAVGSTRTASWNSAMAKARKSGDFGLLIEKIDKMPPEKQPTGWNRAIESLWRSYHRETAAALVVQGAIHSDAEIIQYWIQQVLQIEPEIAAEAFTQDFLANLFKPEIAASCGRCGSCGCG